MLIQLLIAAIFFALGCLSALYVYLLVRVWPAQLRIAESELINDPHNASLRTRYARRSASYVLLRPLVPFLKFGAVLLMLTGICTFLSYLRVL